jgi:hypothetical protein
MEPYLISTLNRAAWNSDSRVLWRDPIRISNCALSILTSFVVFWVRHDKDQGGAHSCFITGTSHVLPKSPNRIISVHSALHNFTVDTASLNYLTPRNRVLLDELVVTLLVKKFTAFLGIRRFIAVFTRANH